MSLSLLATLVSLSIIALFIGLSTSAVLFMFKPDNVLFQALQGVRDYINDDEVVAVPSQAPQAKSTVPPVEDESAKSSPEPVAANSDVPQMSAEEFLDLGMAKHDLGSRPPELVMDDVKAERAWEGALDGHDSASAAELESAKEEFVPENDRHQADESEYQLQGNEGPSLDEILESEKAADEEIAADEGVEDLEQMAFAGGDSSQGEEHLEGTPRSEEWQQESQYAQNSSSEAHHLPASPVNEHLLDDTYRDDATEKTELEASPKSQDDDVFLGGHKSAKNDILASLPVDTPPEEWAAPTEPKVSGHEVLRSERSTDPVQAWKAESESKEVINDKKDVGEHFEIINDREKVQGDSRAKLGIGKSNTSIENNPRIKSDWEIATDRKTSVNDLATPELGSNYQNSVGEGGIDGKMLQPDVGFRGEAMRVPDVIIEEEDKSTADRLRLEALKDNDLRGILITLGNKDNSGPRPKTSVSDLAAEKGPGHERHTTYYVDGKAKTETDWHNGRPHGEFKAWYPSGQPMIEGSYEHGNGAGKWTLWDAGGEQLICADISDILGGWNYKAKVRYINP